MDSRRRALITKINDMLMEHVGVVDQTISADQQVDILGILSMLVGGTIHAMADDQECAEKLAKGVTDYLTASAKRWTTIRQSKPDGATVQ